jgi:CheY-like chemotaxis protein
MSQTPARILIVDDVAINRTILKYGLAQQGYTTCEAEGGREALEFLAREPVDVVLLDVLMPDVDGYQVLAEMKRDESLRHIPVVMVTALEDVDSAARCIELGAEDYLPKPINVVLLEARVSACVEKKRRRDQEILYLRQVRQLTQAAGAVEAHAFDAAMLADVAARDDELGALARVFQRMAGEVQAREERLRRQVQQLRIEIDEVKKAQQVAQVTDTEYFHELEARAQQLRSRTHTINHTSAGADE